MFVWRFPRIESQAVGGIKLRISNDRLEQLLPPKTSSKQEPDMLPSRRLPQAAVREFSYLQGSKQQQRSTTLLTAITAATGSQKRCRIRSTFLPVCTSCSQTPREPHSSEHPCRPPAKPSPSVAGDGGVGPLDAWVQGLLGLYCAEWFMACGPACLGFSDIQTPTCANQGSSMVLHGDRVCQPWFGEVQLVWYGKYAIA